ncbi:MAG: hydrogenase maturation nickel metallochaperone HypA [Ignavibacteria bacterium]|nr:hydrogenase maturation nickel metallochaperone HypA [Ignavibacteria bacterium]
MHELSIAESIVDIIRQYVPDPVLTPVRGVRVKIGAQSGVSPDALSFAFSAITIDTHLEHVALRIEEVPFRLRCEACHKVSDSADGIAICPECGSYSTTVLSGMEMLVSDIDVDDTAVDV